VKVLDVYPDGRAYNLDESIQRMRYRDGYDKPLVWMESGKVYKVTLQPLNTSNYFESGHRLRIEVSSSNFPRFDRNLNTGGNNYDESRGVVAHNAVHHSRQYPSQVTITVEPTRAAVLSAFPNTQSHGEQSRNGLPMPYNAARQP
jgi:putative CocE/NonD family hydrolase